MELHGRSFSGNLLLKIELKTEKSFTLQVFYIDLLAENNRYSEKYSISQKIKGSDEFERYSIKIPSQEIERLRIDFGSVDQNEIHLRSLVLTNNQDSIKWDPDNIMGDFNFGYDLNILHVTTQSLILKVNNYNELVDPLISLNISGIDHMQAFFNRSTFKHKNVVKIRIKSSHIERIAIIPTTKSDSLNYYYRTTYFKKHPPNQLFKLIQPLNNNDHYIANFYLNRNIDGIIFDLGKHIGSEFEIYWIELQNDDIQRTYKGEDLLKYFEFNRYCETNLKDEVLHVKTKAVDRIFIPRFYSKEILISRFDENISEVKKVVFLFLGLFFFYFFNRHYLNMKVK